MRASWCTRDWCGGSNYGPYGFWEAVGIAWRTRRLEPWDRQAVTFVLTVGDQMHYTRWTVDFHPHLRVSKRVWDFREAAKRAGLVR